MGATIGKGIGMGFANVFTLGLINLSKGFRDEYHDEYGKEYKNITISINDIS